ncbi:MAG TPA: right-handed parallel beta-helix repeat-containing protein [Lacipirellulaceae bacterium]
MGQRFLPKAAALCCFLVAGRSASAVDRTVGNTSQFSAALAAASPGDRILLQPGVYAGGHFRANLRQVTIRSVDPANRAIIDGGANALQLSDAQQVTIEHLEFRNQTGNGLNIDDGGPDATPSTDITLRNIVVRDIVTPGNYDGIKLSGVDRFLIEGVQVRNWGTGGSAVDMVGCHHGLIQNSLFAHTNTANEGTTLQPKGGSKDITFRANRIELPPDAGRAVQAGGSTGPAFFRFIDGDSDYEADEVVAEGNVIIGGSSAFSWVNIDGGVFHHNFVHRPYRWVARILNENQGNDIIDTRNGQLHDNRIVYNDTSSELSTAVNVGAETLPATYLFARNRWLNIANPNPAGSTPSLPTAEQGGVYGDRSLDGQLDHAIVWDFTWGKWIVNANTGADSVDIPNFAALRRATPGEAARFQPLQADPLEGPWTSAAIPSATIQLPAFSQVILIDPVACPNCLGIAGDYDGNGIVNGLDYDVWRAAFGNVTGAADGNGDGTVNAADYVVWRAGFARASVASAAVIGSAIPEPLSSVIGALACAVSFVARLR